MPVRRGLTTDERVRANAQAQLLRGQLAHYDRVEDAIARERGDEPWVLDWRQSMARRRQRVRAQLDEALAVLRGRSR